MSLAVDQVNVLSPSGASTAPTSPKTEKSAAGLSVPLLNNEKATKEKSKPVISRESAQNIRQKNIHCMYLHTAFMTLYQSICCWNVFDAYLAILAKQSGSPNANTWVGAAESVTGLSTLLFAVPSGILADRMDRVMMVRFAGCLGILASCTSLLGFLSDDWHIIFLNMGLWGLFTSIMGTAAEAMFADSCPAGNRSKMTATKGSLQTVGLAAGPLIMYGVFYFLGDSWTISTLHVPLIIGCTLGPIAAIPCFFMDDVRNYKVASNVTSDDPMLRSVQGDQLASNLGLLRQRGMTTATLGEDTLEPRVPAASLSVAHLGRHRGASRAVNEEYAEALEEDRIDDLIMNADEEDINVQIEREEQRFRNMTPMQRAVPFILTAADFITEVGAGMTVRFFPLFFIADFGVRPTTMSLIFGVYPALVALAIVMCQHISVVTGRTQISWLFQLCGIFCLLGMVYITNLPVLIGVFFLRSCFQNAAYPVDRSILYDYIPSSQRGRWASIASLTTMTWSGSAVIGGWIADGHDYRYTFVITSIIYAVGLTIYTPLLWLVPKEVADIGEKSK